MQVFFILAFISAVVSVTVRQSAPPACAYSCLTSTNTHGCSITDTSCLCHNSQFVADQTACITSACTNPSDLQQAVTFAQQNCLSVGVTLSATPTAAASGSSAAATAVASASSSAASSSRSASASNNAVSTLRGTAPAVILGGIIAYALAL